MSPDYYLQDVLNWYGPNVGLAKEYASTLYPVIQNWAGDKLIEVIYSGSIAKGTSISIGSDADIFISLSSTTQESLQQIFDSLEYTLSSHGYKFRRQNVSIGVFINGHKIDVTPGRRQSQWGYDHSIYKSKENSWTQTDVKTHINYVANSNRLSEIKLLKIWRELRNIDFTSFYLEMVVIEHLKNVRIGNIANNFWSVLGFLETDFINTRYIDPANTANIISNDLTIREKQIIVNAAAESKRQSNWQNIIWKK